MKVVYNIKFMLYNTLIRPDGVVVFNSSKHCLPVKCSLAQQAVTATSYTICSILCFKSL